MKKIWVLMGVVLLSASVMAANIMHLMRTPDASATKVCFIYQDDLFTANLDGSNPVRLIKAVGTEAYPKFSPDGKWIAFSSYFNGNPNVYIIPSEGGTVRQLTFEPEGAAMLEWSNNGKEIYFLSRAASFSPFFARIFKVSVEGGLPEVLPVDQASTLCFNDKGDGYVLNRHSLYFWWWKRYKGTANTDIWMYTKKSGKFVNLTNTPINESWPMWVGNNIYFVSEKGKMANLYRMNLKTKKQVRLTNFKKDNVQWPSLSSDRKRIVFECNAGIYSYNIQTGKTVEIRIPDTVQNVVPGYEFVNPVKFLDTYDISTTGKRAVFSARGEIFSAPAKNGEIRQLTFDCAARDTEPVWSPGGGKIAFISDRDGIADNIYLVDQFAKTAPVKLTHHKTNFLKNLMWSPDGKYLSYQSNDFALWVYNTKTKKEFLVNRSKRYGQMDYTWSPDSAWIAYTILGSNMVPEIHVYNLTAGKDHLLFRSFEQNHNPAFSTDGKYLYFVTDREGANSRIAMMSLTREDKDPLAKPWDEEKVVEKKNTDKSAKTDKKETDPKDKKAAKGKKDGKVTVKIDFDGIMNRVQLLPVTGYSYVDLKAGKAGLYIGFMPLQKKLEAGKKIDWNRGFNLYLYNIEKEKLTPIAKGIQGFAISHDGKKVLLAKKSSFQIISAGRPAGKEGRISLAKLSMHLDRRAEWHQIFNESWRLIRDNFYDPNIHGVNWPAMKKKYGKLIDYCQTRNDVNRVLVQLVGELNASHQGARGGDMPHPKKVTIGSIGAQLTPDKSGFYKFEKIYPGNPFYKEYQAPLGHPWQKVKQGNYLIAIDGSTVHTNVDYHMYLLNTVGRTVFLKVNDKPEVKGAWEVKVKPISSEYRLRYLNWVEHNRKLVEEKSHGRIGYIHLNYMMGAQLNTFLNAIHAYFDKEGLILDVRFNGGGGIDPQLIDYLERRQYQITRIRDGIDLPRPQNIFRGKVVVLCNEHSYSDAEVFPNAFKVLGLGKLIGVQTLGFVLAVNEHELIDGGSIRKTFIGIWDIHGHQLESRGAIPDIIVQNNPNDLAKGIDAQLNKAIEVLTREINAKSVFPKVKTTIRPR
ncbi:MAG: hypothetical protein GXO69_05105 [Acidobacteria bacterium]|nr:hypothetical protein [Acidobacteriota bacterium]